MRDDHRFALVLRTGAKGIAPGCPFDFGICFVEGDTARTSFVDIEALDRTLGDFPTVPSIYGSRPGIVSFEAEMEAVDTLTAAADAFSTKYSSDMPPAFSLLREKLDGGLAISIADGRIGFEIAQWAAQALSWHAGDRVDMAASPDGMSFAIVANRDGTALVDAGRPGWFSTARDWPLPRRSDAASGEQHVPLAISDGSVLFELAPAEVRISSESPAATSAPPLPQVLPFDYRWGLISLAAVYAAVSVVLKII
ncbi:hypothetical protein GOB57_08855 [Sinorhizobium meliloti]|nr:hypothetical protein [Sinorhizobium meliloti]